MFTASSLLLQWFSHHSLRNRTQIKMSCRSLALNFHTDPASAFYTFFMPLVRIGVVEFVGNGIYQLAPTVILQDTDKNCQIAINPCAIIKAIIKNNFDAVEPLYNIIRFQCSHEQLNKFLEQYPIPLIQNDIVGLLAQFPDVKSVIHQLPRVMTFPSKQLFYDPFTLSLTDRSYSFGIYKENEGAHVYFFQDINQQIYKMPPPEVNPEIFPIALCYQSMLMRRPLLRYDRSGQQLYVQGPLPVLLEKTLRIPSLSICEAWPTLGKELCLPNITEKHYQSVQRILCLNT
jgi:hypothetical protein